MRTRPDLANLARIASGLGAIYTTVAVVVFYLKLTNGNLAILFSVVITSAVASLPYLLFVLSSRLTTSPGVQSTLLVVSTLCVVVNLFLYFPTFSEWPDGEFIMAFWGVGLIQAVVALVCMAIARAVGLRSSKLPPNPGFERTH